MRQNSSSFSFSAKLICFLLSLLMIIGVFGTTVFAAGETEAAAVATEAQVPLAEDGGVDDVKGGPLAVTVYTNADVTPTVPVTVAALTPTVNTASKTLAFNITDTEAYTFTAAATANVTVGGTTSLQNFIGWFNYQTGEELKHTDRALTYVLKGLPIAAVYGTAAPTSGVFALHTIQTVDTPTATVTASGYTNSTDSPRAYRYITGANGAAVTLTAEPTPGNGVDYWTKNTVKTAETGKTYSFTLSGTPTVTPDAYSVVTKVVPVTLDAKTDPLGIGKIQYALYDATNSTYKEWIDFPEDGINTATWAADTQARVALQIVNADGYTWGNWTNDQSFITSTITEDEKPEGTNGTAVCFSMTGVADVVFTANYVVPTGMKITAGIAQDVAKYSASPTDDLRSTLAELGGLNKNGVAVANLDDALWTSTGAAVRNTNFGMQKAGDAFAINDAITYTAVPTEKFQLKQWQLTVDSTSIVITYADGAYFVDDVKVTAANANQYPWLGAVGTQNDLNLRMCFGVDVTLKAIYTTKNIRTLHLTSNGAFSAITNDSVDGNGTPLTFPAASDYVTEKDYLATKADKQVVVLFDASKVDGVTGDPAASNTLVLDTNLEITLGSQKLAYSIYEDTATKYVIFYMPSTANVADVNMKLTSKTAVGTMAISVNPSDYYGTLTVNGNAVEGASITINDIKVGDVITASVADAATNNRYFEGWYLNGVLVTAERTYTYTAKDVTAKTLVAKYIPLYTFTVDTTTASKGKGAVSIAKAVLHANASATDPVQPIELPVDSAKFPEGTIFTIAYTAPVANTDLTQWFDKAADGTNVTTSLTRDPVPAKLLWKTNAGLTANTALFGEYVTSKYIHEVTAKDAAGNALPIPSPPAAWLTTNPADDTVKQVGDTYEVTAETAVTYTPSAAPITVDDVNYKFQYWTKDGEIFNSAVTTDPVFVTANNTLNVTAKSDTDGKYVAVYAKTPDANMINVVLVYNDNLGVAKFNTATTIGTTALIAETGYTGTEFTAATGTVLPLAAEAKTGNTFNGWRQVTPVVEGTKIVGFTNTPSGVVNTNLPEIKLQVPAANDTIYLMANFEAGLQEKVVIDTDIVGRGDIVAYDVTSGFELNVAADGTVEVIKGHQVELMAIAQPGYVFARWDSNGVIQISPATLQFTAKAGLQYTANFAAADDPDATYTYSVHPTLDIITDETEGPQGGAVVMPEQGVEYQVGTQVIVIAGEKPGYTFRGFYLAGDDFYTEADVLPEGAYYGQLKPGKTPVAANLISESATYKFSLDQDYTGKKTICAYFTADEQETTLSLYMEAANGDRTQHSNIAWITPTAIPALEADWATTGNVKTNNVPTGTELTLAPYGPTFEAGVTYTFSHWEVYKDTYTKTNADVLLETSTDYPLIDVQDYACPVEIVCVYTAKAANAVAVTSVDVADKTATPMNLSFATVEGRADYTSFIAGQEVTINANEAVAAEAGYKFLRWEIKYGTNWQPIWADAEKTFTMPGYAVALRAVYEKGVGTLNVDATPNAGGVVLTSIGFADATKDYQNAAKQNVLTADVQSVAIQALPTSGYIFKGWYIVDQNGVPDLTKLPDSVDQKLTLKAAATTDPVASAYDNIQYDKVYFAAFEQAATPTPVKLEVAEPETGKDYGTAAVNQYLAISYVEPQKVLPDEAGKVPQYTIAEIAATPDEGYMLTGWEFVDESIDAIDQWTSIVSGDSYNTDFLAKADVLVNSSNLLVLYLKADLQIRPVFAESTMALTVTADAAVLASPAPDAAAKLNKATVASITDIGSESKTGSVLSTTTAANTVLLNGGVDFDAGDKLTITPLAATGKVWNGWFTDEDKTKAFDPSFAQISEAGVITMTVPTTDQLTAEEQALFVTDDTFSIELFAKFVDGATMVTLTTAADPADAAVTSPTKASVSIGAVVEISANTSVGTNYIFAGWYDGDTLVSTEATFDYTVTKAVNLVAKYTQGDTCTFNFIAEGEGTIVNTYGDVISGTSVVYFGGLAPTMDITAVPAEGYLLDAWYVDGTLIHAINQSYAELNLKMAELMAQGKTNVDVKAVFVPQEVLIQGMVQPEAAGSIEGAGTYNVGETVTLEAVAGAGYTFTQWYKLAGTTIVPVGTDNPLTFVASEDATYYAFFEEVETTTLYIQYNAAQGDVAGLINGIEGFVDSKEVNGYVVAEYQLPVGSRLNLTALENSSSYVFTQWKYEGLTFAVLPTIDFTVPALVGDQDSITLKALFRYNPIARVGITPAVVGGGAIRDLATGSILTPNESDFVLYPDKAEGLVWQATTLDMVGTQFDHWEIYAYGNDRTPVISENSTLVLNPITNGMRIVAVFEPFVPVASLRGATAPSGVLSTDDTVFSSLGALRLVGEEGKVNVSLIFNEENAGTVNDGFSTIRGNANFEYDVDAELTWTAAANEGYAFTGWVIGDREVAGPTVTFKAADASTVCAVFQKIDNAQSATGNVEKSATIIDSNTTGTKGAALVSVTGQTFLDDVENENFGWIYDQNGAGIGTGENSVEYAAGTNVVATAQAFSAAAKFSQLTLSIDGGIPVPVDGNVATFTVEEGKTYALAAYFVTATPVGQALLTGETRVDGVQNDAAGILAIVGDGPDVYLDAQEAITDYQAGAQLTIAATAFPGYELKSMAFYNNGTLVTEGLDATLAITLGQGSNVVVANYDPATPVGQALLTGETRVDGVQDEKAGILAIVGDGPDVYLDAQEAITDYQAGAQLTIAATAFPGYKVTSMAFYNNGTLVAEAAKATMDVTLGEGSNVVVANYTPPAPAGAIKGVTYMNDVASDAAGVITDAFGTSLDAEEALTSYRAGDEITLTATPFDAHNFLYMVVEVNGVKGTPITENPATFTLEEGTTVVHAYFDDIPVYQITAQPNAANRGTTEGSGLYKAGNACTVTATAKDGYRFSFWFDGTDVVSADAAYTFTVEDAELLIAVFMPRIDLFQTTATHSAGGNAYFQIAGTTAKLTDANVPAGKTVTFTAETLEGYTFASWTDVTDPANPVVVGTEATLTYDVQAVRTLRADFNLIQVGFPVNVTVDPEGAASITGDGNYPADANATIVAYPEEGYQVLSWTVNGTVVENDSDTLYLANIDEPIDVVLTLTSDWHVQVLQAVGGQASFTIEGDEGIYTDKWVADQTNVAFTAKPDEGMQFLGWIFEGGTGALFTYNPMAGIVDSNVVIRPVFEEIPTYGVDVSVNPEGSAVITGGGDYKADTAVQIAATEIQEGYRIASWTINGITIPFTEASFTLTNAISQSYNVVANLVQSFQVTANQAEGGLACFYVNDGVSQLTAEVDAGSKVTFAAIANTGYEFTEWQDAEGTAVSTDSIYVVESLDKDMQLTPIFAALPTHTVEVIAEGNGLVSLDDTTYVGDAIAYNVIDGAQMVLYAQAGENDVFDGWFYQGTIEPFSTETVLPVTVESDLKVYARFTGIAPEISHVSTSAQPAEGGTAGFYVGAGTALLSAGDFVPGTLLTLVAQPAEGYDFIGWKFGKDASITERENYYDFTVTGNVEIIAVFEEKVQTANIITYAAPVGSGNTTGGNAYEIGETVTLTATPLDGYQFVAWYILDGEETTLVSEEATYSFTATGDAGYLARFELVAQDVAYYEAIPAGYGSVALDAGHDAAVIGSTLTAIAEDDCEFLCWMRKDVGGSTYDLVGILPDYQVTAEDINKVLVAYFKHTAVPAPTAKYAVMPAGSGSISLDEQHTTATEGAVLSANANTNYQFLYWLRSDIGSTEYELVSRNSKYLVSGNDLGKQLTALFMYTGGDPHGKGF